MYKGLVMMLVVLGDAGGGGVVPHTVEAMAITTPK